MHENLHELCADVVLQFLPNYADSFGFMASVLFH